MKKLLRLTDFVFDVGRPVAYYPQFKLITGSTVATIFLCQMLYWTQITLGDWVYKSMDDWTDETGLSEQEQRTARKHLTEKGILIEKWDNINKQMYYRLNIRKLNEIWDEVSGGHSDFTQLIIDKFDRDMATIKPEFKYGADEESVTTLEEQESDIKAITEKRKAHSDVVKKGDGVDMALVAMPSVKASIKIGIILSHIEQRLNIVAEDARWKAFAKFALQRKELYGEDIRIFTTYAIENGFDPVYWSPEKCKTLWTRAFSTGKKEDYSIPELPEPVKNPEALDSAPDKLFELSSRKP